MNFLSIKKPKNLPKLKKIDFKLINDPLENVIKKFINLLKYETRPPKNFNLNLWGLLESSYLAYKAARKLIARDPKYPVQAHILSRSILDSLFNICLLVEDPNYYSRKFELAGYLSWRKEYERRKIEYENDPRFKELIDIFQEHIEKGAKYYNLSNEEKENPEKNIKRWPIPSRILNKKLIKSTEKREFLQKIYKDHYGEVSEISHQTFTGMAMGVYANIPEEHWYPEKIGSDALYRCILFLLMILSEIDAEMIYKQNQKLKYIWTLLSSFFLEAKEYYNIRYDNFLQYK